MKNVTKILLSIVINLSVLLAGTSLAFAAPTTPAPAASPTSGATTPADNKSAVCDGIALTGSGCNDTGGPSVDSAVKLAISVLSFVVGIAAVIMIMVGGFKYVISSGDSNNINSAKNTILYAIIGLVVAVLAQIIVRFVLFQAK